MIYTAVIMEAGLGTRFGEQTVLKPKGSIPFKGNPMVERSIQTLIDCGAKKIIIGTGYHKSIMRPLLINTMELNVSLVLASLRPTVCTLFGIAVKQ